MILKKVSIALHPMLGMESLLFWFGLGIVVNGLGVVLTNFKKLLQFPSGILAAFFVGIGLFTFNPFSWFLLLIFFVSSSFLTRFRAPRKQDVQHKFEKGGRRDAWQVFANGFPPVVYGLLAFLFNANPLSPLLIASAAYFAAVNADTFQTEIGVLSKSKPRWILDLREEVERGTSGGVTAQGFLAGAGGSFEIASLFGIGVYTVLDPNRAFLDIFIAGVIVFLGGNLGALFDSLLGASVQGFYFCPTCQTGTEKRVHLKCGGTETQLTRGREIITNDWVNILSATTASLLAGLIWFLLC